MAKKNKKNSNLYLILGTVVLLSAAGFLFFSNFKITAGTVTGENSEGAAELRQKFDLLSKAGTNLCAAPSFIDSKTWDERLQGACCSAMDFHRYTEQVEGLKKYSGIAQIPTDPYDIPVSLAKELLEYDKTVQLTAEQQAIYDEALTLSNEGGPCCCKCWRWYAFEGQAKYLITEQGFNAQQIAELWDLEDGCGGPGHATGH